MPVLRWAARQRACGGENLGVRAAAAEIPGHGALDLLIGWLRVAEQERLEREHLARCAEATLQRVVLDERLLHGVERVVVGQPLNGRDGASLALDGEQQTTVDSLAIQQDGASATLAHIAAWLGARQVQVFAQGVQQCAAWLHAQRADSSVDG